MGTNLFTDIGKTGFHSSIATTYSVDPAFYDGSIEYRLRMAGCENNILMADAAMLERALAATPEAFTKAGLRYALVPVAISSCFHPKVILRLGKASARLVIGSANATAAGWGTNREIIAAFDVRPDAEDEGRLLLPLVRRLYDYLASWLRDVQGDALSYKLDLHRREAPWLFEIEDVMQPIVLSDGSALDLFCVRGDGRGEGMMGRLVRLVGDEEVVRLVLVSPYWDTDLAALHALAAAFPRAEVVVGLDPETSAFPTRALADLAAPRFADISADRGGRFVHAKLILVETRNADHVLFGSPNCSDDALGTASIPARNAEVGLYRRLPPRSFLARFALDLSRSVDIDMVKEPAIERDPFTGRVHAFSGGVVEIEDGALVWWPPQGLADAAARGARLIHQETPHRLVPLGNGTFRARGDTPFGTPAVVRIALSDGRMSNRIVVHDDRMLRATAPGSTDKRLRTALDRVARGEDDFIALALQAHLLFSDDGSPRRSGASGQRRRDKLEEGGAFSSPENFREAMLQAPANGHSGRYWVDEPGLRNLLRIITNGIDLRRDLDKEDEEENRSLDDGDHQDGEDEAAKLEEDRYDGTSSTGADVGGQNGTPPDPDDYAHDQAPDNAQENARDGRTNRVYTQVEISTLRRSLDKAFTQLEADLERLRHSGTEDDVTRLRLPARIVFILHLMSVAACHSVRTLEGEARLMTFAPTPGGDRNLCFSVRAGRILQALWSGDDRIVERLPHEPHRRMADDVFQFVVMSRWAIDRACQATQGQSLQPFLVKLRAEVLRGALCCGPIDPDAELLRRRELETLFPLRIDDTSRKGIIEPALVITSKSKAQIPSSAS